VESADQDLSGSRAHHCWRLQLFKLLLVESLLALKLSLPLILPGCEHGIVPLNPFALLVDLRAEGGPLLVKDLLLLIVHVVPIVLVELSEEVRTDRSLLQGAIMLRRVEVLFHLLLVHLPLQVHQPIMSLRMGVKRLILLESNLFSSSRSIRDPMRACCSKF